MCSEYGWTFNYVLDLPICSLRQMAETIKVRVKANRQHAESLIEWQTRVLAQFMAGAAPSPEQSKALSKAADKISIKGGEADTVGERVKPGEASDPDVYVEQGSQVAADRNGVGSYERLSGRFGAK